MSAQEKEPLLDEAMAVYLALVVNRIADSFDVGVLSTEEVCVVYMLLDRLNGALWREHGETVLPLVESLTIRLSRDDESEDSDEDDDSEDGGVH